MKKDNNKGFTLIEIIIAVAVLSLLLTPILQQFTQTMSTNRKAKEQQYANSEATRLLEVYQSMEKDEITAALKNSGTTVACTLYYKDGDELKQVEDVSGGFTYTVAKLSETAGKAGNSRAEYTKDIIIDDMVTRLLSYSTGYNLKYGQTSTDLEFYNNAGSGFELNNEGNIVRYDSEGHVVAAVVEPYVNSGYTNPNETNVISLNNLNAKTSAMVLDATTDFDSQANEDFKSQIIDVAYNKKDTVPQANNDYIQITNGIDLFEQFDLNVRKKTYVTVETYVKDGDSVVKPAYVKSTDVIDHYIVTVKVEYTFGLDPNRQTFTYIAASDLHALTYDVYSKTFTADDVTKVPAVYIEYQPYSDNVKEAYYVKDDYIVLDSNTEGAKLFLIKPQKDKDYYAVSNAERDYFLYEDNVNKKTTITISSSLSTKLQSDGVDTMPDVVTNISKSCIKLTDGEGTDRHSTNLKTVGEDKENNPRLYTLTVKLTPSGSNSDRYNDVSLSGAWGDK